MAEVVVIVVVMAVVAVAVAGVAQIVVSVAQVLVWSLLPHGGGYEAVELCGQVAGVVC